MPDHDPLCPATIADGRWRARCECDLIARVRADERRRELLAVCECGCMERDAHAETVAARLVEVIRVDDLRLRTRNGHIAQARRERDAARAEVAALRELVEVQGRNIRREVLADLRAKAEVLPERADAHTEECPGRPGYRGICTCEGDILISRAAVLTLFDEAAR